MKIKKRNGLIVDFDKVKIIKAINAALIEVDKEIKDKELANKLALQVEQKLFNLDIVSRDIISVEEIQDIVEELLMASNRKDVAKAYIRYRYKREIMRSTNETYDSILKLIDFSNDELNVENSNKNSALASTQRDYMAGEVSKDLTKNFFLPKDIADAHKEGIIHFHDADYFAQKIYNCCLWNLEDMLQNSTLISNTLIEKPHSFSTACNIATQIMAQVASSQYGGQTFSLAHLAPFVDVSRQKIRKEIVQENNELDLGLDDNQLDKLIDNRLYEEIRRGVQTLQYQILTLQTTNGQTPFVSVFMYLNEAKTPREKEDLALVIAEMLRQREVGVKNEKGVWVSPTFPKLLYVLEDDNITPDSKYWYLTKMAASCTAKRMVPDYISEKIMKQIKIDANGEGQCFPCMGCRSFLSPYVDANGNPKYYGRFNQGVVTINLPDAALAANKDLNKFYQILDERLELCHRALQIRHKHLEGTPSDIAPILWQNGAIARLKKGETIDHLLHGDYSTISLGFAGLWECVYALIGKKLTTPEGKELGLQIMQTLNDYTAKWRESENIGYSLYGTPLESTTYKFAKALKKHYGIVEGVSDKDYVSNSYHIHVTEDIDAFSKLAFEAEFQKLSPGGAISYVEVPNLTNNIPAVLEVIKFIYNHIMYAELNTKSDYCMNCGFDGEIKIVKNQATNELVWECPNCKNRDKNKMSVVRRTCGYLGANWWNQGRTEEILDRKLHL